MIDRILAPKVQSFIDEHQRDDVNDLLLKYKLIHEVPVGLVADQIVGRRKAKEKIPTWFSNRKIIYPPSLSVEQSSSEKTARYKVRVLNEIFGSAVSKLKLVDLTGGLGVDSFFFSQVCNRLDYVERNNELLKITAHNFAEMGVENVSFHNSDATIFLESLLAARQIDLVYVDPARRTTGGQKVFSLNQCEPNLPNIQSAIWSHTQNLLVKTSPLLDITQGIHELQNVKEVYVVSILNECKEVLFHCDKNFGGEPVIQAVNLDRKETSFSFTIPEEQSADAKQSNPMTYLYEPNASILKAGAFKIVASKFNVNKLHPNTHLYTSETMVADFPGRIFKVEGLVKPERSILKDFFADGKANVFTRNYPLDVAAIRKTTGLKEGGEKFLIGCSGSDKKFLIVASRLDRE